MRSTAAVPDLRLSQDTAASLGQARVLLVTGPPATAVGGAVEDAEPERGLLSGSAAGGAPIKPAEPVLVFGYPLAEALSSAGDTTLGNVTALTRPA